ncbi:MAG: SHOCT domain-containing protein [Myxococcota bacterium]
MRNGRSTGLILMALAIAAFLGSTSERLPAETFFPALALFAVGALQFMRSNRVALTAAEQRVHEKLHPTIREDRSALARAQRPAQRRGAVLDAINGDAPPSAAARTARASSRNGIPSAAPQPGGLEVERVETPAGEFEITSDVSYPVELQRGEALADSLRKLNQLRVQGILTEEEFAIAKARLLG